MSQSGRIAVILVNTGSPEAPTKEAVGKYLIEFLGDRRVVELHPLIWQPILRGIVVPRRSQDAANRYRSIWTENGSPLVDYTLKTARALDRELGEGFDVTWAMCYGSHKLADELARVIETNPERIVILPMFAQYATQTSAAVFDIVDRVIKKYPTTAPIVRIESYFDDPNYIACLASNVREHWAKAGELGPNDRLVMSFHGIPAVSSERGDPYERQCNETARLLANALGLEDSQWVLCYQSKFGRAKWLEPSAIDTVQRLAREGHDRIDVVCPGFAADCIETLEEIQCELKEIYEQAGGKTFGYVPAPNDGEQAVRGYARLILRALAS